MIKAVIIAGGKGIRMQPLTFTRPKPLLKVVGKTIIKHNLEQLKGLIKEAIIVIGYRGDMIRSAIGDRCHGIKINYVVQEFQIGTGDAAKKAIELIDDKFLLLNGDDLYFREDIKKCLKKNPSILLGSADNPSLFGIVECDDDFIKGLIEKPENPPRDSLVNTGLYFLDKSIFDFCIEKSSRGEYEFTDYIRALIKSEKLYFVKTDKWIPVSYPWDFLKANENMIENIKRSIIGKVEKNCVVIGKVNIKKNAFVKGGTRIEGPVVIESGAIIGPNAFIRGNTIIGRDCRIGAGVEIKSSVIGDRTSISHLSYIGDSVIGEDCNIGGGTIMANLRLDRENVKVNIKDIKVDSGREKLGSIIGDGASIGVNSSLMPGTVIGSDSVVGPNSMVKGIIPKDSVYSTHFDQVIKKNESE